MANGVQYEYMVKQIRAYLEAHPDVKPYHLENAAGVGRNTIYDILARRKKKVFLDTWLKIKAVIDSPGSTEGAGR